MKKIILILTALFILTACSKDKETSVNTTPTNIGTGKINYNDWVNLAVKATENETSYELKGEGKYSSNGTITVTIKFAKKPTAGNYKIGTDNVETRLVAIDGSITSGIMEKDGIITVTVNGNRVDASFKNAVFNFGASTNTFTGNLSVD
jgi:uncharacterized lipoprotein YajG